jgi:hypothetical protein
VAKYFHRRGKIMNSKRLISGKICLLVVLGLLVVGSAQGTIITVGKGWIEYPSNPIFDPTAKAYYPTIEYDASQFSGHGDAAYYKMWFGSDAGTGYAYSNDGLSWTEGTNPVSGLAANANHATVKYFAGGFAGVNSGNNPSGSTMYYRIWYWPGLSYSINDIRYAESPDGTNWYNDQPLQNGAVPIISGISPDWNRGSYGPCDVLHNPGASNSGTDWTFTMYYDGTTGGDESIGLGFSANGITWTGYDADSDGDADPVLVGSGSGWDQNYVSRATILKLSASDYRMWYSGGVGSMNHGIGYARSTNGIAWTKSQCNPIFHKTDGVAWRSDRTYCPVVMYQGGTWKMWFSGVATGNYTIGYASASDIGEYCSIQAAINAASPGDTVKVLAGTYIEQLYINKSLDLIGVGSKPVIQAPPAGTRTTHTIPESGRTFDPIIFADGGVGVIDVTVDNFDIDGNNDGGSNTFCGILFRNTDPGTISNNDLHRLRGTGQETQGILMYGANTDVTVSGNTVTEFSRNGITANVDAQAVISGNTVTGDGPLPSGNWAQNGIQIGYGASGSITGNTVTGCSILDPNWAASGILALQSTGTTQINGNTITENEVNIYLGDCSASIQGNTINATATGTGQTYFWGIVGDPGETRVPKPTPFGEIARTAQPTDIEDNSSGTKATYTMTCTDNTVESDGSAGGTGIGVYAGMYGTYDIDFVATGNKVRYWQWGIELYEYEVNELISAEIHNNIIEGNTDYGLYSSAAVVADASDNYWGSWDGPQDDVGTDEATVTQCYDVSTMKNEVAEISPPLGNAVSEGVEYCPWTSSGVAFNPESIIYHCSGNFSFAVEIGYAVQDMEAAHFVIDYPAQLVLASVTKASSNYTLYYALTDNSTGNDVLTVDLGVMSGSQNGPATLFTVALNGSVDLCSGYQIAMTDVDLRDSENNPIPVPLASPIELMADCSDPDIVVNSPTSGGYYNTAPVLDLTATDNCDLDAVYYQIDGCLPGGWSAIATGLSGTTYNNTAWTVPGFGGLSEAEHCVRFKVLDDAARANSDSCTYTWCFTKDVTAPPPPTDLTAQPGHNKVKLTWNNATSDFDHTVVMRTDWYSGGHGYPEYDDDNAEGPYPVDTTCCDRVYAGTGTSLTDVSDISNTTRDVYHYKAFTVDAAGNVSAPSNGVRSTSYWLGDVGGGDSPPYINNYDGYVYYQDLAILSSTYWKSHGEGGYLNQFDIGPTATGSPKGIPTTDNIIDFEDLSIFAINFDAVNPSMKIAPIFAGEEITGPLGLQLLVPGNYYLQAGNEFKVMVLLKNNPGLVKSIHFVLPYNRSQLEFIRVEKSKLIQGAPVSVFFNGRDVDHRVDVSLALLGGEVTIGGSGEIATITFRLLQAGNLSLAFSLVDLRDNQNNKLLAEQDVAQLQSGSVLPQAYGLSQNYPNVFNPETQIAYQLPQAGLVSLKVYNIKGELVRTLVDEYKEAGYHTVRWDGRNQDGNEVASGVYFYRLVTNDFSSTKKMIMMK